VFYYRKGFEWNVQAKTQNGKKNLDLEGEKILGEFFFSCLMME
jgi:hypothetical protein